MTSEPDSTPGPRPPTIELKATEVGVEKPEAAPQPGDAGAAAGDETQASSARPPRESRSLLAGIVGGAIAAVVIGAGLWFAGYIPPPTPAPAPSAAKLNDPAIADLATRLAKIENAPQAQPRPDPALVSRLTAAEAATKLLGDSVAALNRHVDEVADAAQSAAAQAKTAASAVDATSSAAQGGVARSDLDALSARVATLESTVKKLADNATNQPHSADDRAARLTVAAEALRAAVERSAPFQAELAAVKSFGVDHNAAAALEPFATTGVPSAAMLAHELEDLAPALQQAAEPASANSTFLGRLETNAQHLVQITPVDAPVGDDPASVATRIAVDAAQADIAAALADIAKLPDAAKPPAAAWVQKAQAREAAIAASRKLAADALAALTKPNPQ